MPVKIANDLPAAKQLEEENIFIMSKERAEHQDIRELRIAILNLMPTKIVTETQLLRLLSNTPLQTDIRFIKISTHNSKNTPAKHMETFYEPLEDILDERFDGLIITGAPIETLPYEEVDYWPELVRILNWSAVNVWSTMHICWGAQAGLYHHYGIPKHRLEKKMFGLYHHKALDLNDPILRGFDEIFLAPHSRYTEVLTEDILNTPDLNLLAVSEEAGAYLAASRDRRRIFITGHPEYDRLTLKAEYDRDTLRGLDISVPKNYFPDNNPEREPFMTWRSHAHLLYSNWLNYCVYQVTPYNLGVLGGTNKS